MGVGGIPTVPSWCNMHDCVKNCEPIYKRVHIQTFYSNMVQQETVLTAANTHDMDGTLVSLTFLTRNQPEMTDVT